MKIEVLSTSHTIDTTNPASPSVTRSSSVSGLFSSWTSGERTEGWGTGVGGRRRKKRRYKKKYVCRSLHITSHIALVIHQRTRDLRRVVYAIPTCDSRPPLQLYPCLLRHSQSYLTRHPSRPPLVPFFGRKKFRRRIGGFTRALLPPSGVESGIMRGKLAEIMDVAFAASTRRS